MGCTSLQYILPTRFIFRHSDQVPEAMEGVAAYLGQRPASSPVLIHCLSDTGVMSFQVGNPDHCYGVLSLSDRD